MAGQAGKQVRLRHGAALMTRHTACVRRSGDLTDGVQNPSATSSAPAPPAVEPPAGSTPASAQGATVHRSPRTRSVGTSEMLRQAAVALQASVRISAAAVTPTAACSSSSTGLEADFPGSTAVGQLLGSSLAQALRTDTGNLDAQLEKLHAQWQHMSAPGNLAHRRMNGVLDPTVLTLAEDVATRCSVCRVAGAEVGLSTALAVDSAAADSSDPHVQSSTPAPDGGTDEHDALRRYASLITRREQRRRTEVPVGEAGTRFDNAMDSEPDALAERVVYTQVCGQRQRVLSTRWVYTIKSPRLPADPPKLKARLCVRGFEHPNRAIVDNASSTVSRASVRLVLSAAVSTGWVFRTVGASTALLKGMPNDRSAPVHVRPATYTRVPAGVIWRLNQCAYGLTDAPRICYIRSIELLECVGATRTEEDHRVFTRHANGILVLLVAVHVDDYLFEGTAQGVAAFERVLRMAFTVGPTLIGSFTFTSLRVITRNARTAAMDVTVDQDAYIDSIEDVNIDPHRMLDSSQTVDRVKLTEYRRATEAPHWATWKTVPHLAYVAALLARRFKDGRVADLVRANKVIRLMRKARGMPLLFIRATGSRHLVLFTHSSSVTLRAPISRAGFAHFLTSAAEGARGRVLDGFRRSTLVIWGSHRQRGITHSSFAAEAFALLHYLQAALVLASVAGALLRGQDQASLPVHVVTDALVVHDAFSSHCDSGSKEVRAVLEALRDYYTSGAMATII